MRLTIILIGFLLTASLFAVSATYNIPKLPDGFEPTIDGNLSDWADNPAYFIDSIHSDTNVLAESEVSEPWTRADFQYYLYAAWNDRKIFFAAKVVADDFYNNCTTSVYNCDNIKLNQLGKGTFLYIYPNGKPKPAPSCPWTLGTTAWVAANPLGFENRLPVYEWALEKETTAPYGATTFRLFPGTEEVDDTTVCPDGAGICRDQTIVCVGAGGFSDKQWLWFSSTWDRVSQWPTFNLQVVSSETNTLSTPLSGLVRIHPNPFKGSVTIEFNAISGSSSKLTIYTLDGKKVFTAAINRTGAIVWSPKNLAPGIYLCRMKSGNDIYSKSILLSR